MKSWSIQLRLSLAIVVSVFAGLSLHSAPVFAKPIPDVCPTLVTIANHNAFFLMAPPKSKADHKIQNFEKKLKMEQTGIAALGEKGPPEIISLQEVSPYVFPALKEHLRYGTAATSGVPFGGIDVGVLASLPLAGEPRALRVQMGVSKKGKPVYEEDIRAILEAPVLQPNGRTLHLFVNHWSPKATAWRKNFAAKILRERLEQLHNEDPDVDFVVMGDLNANVDHEAVNRLGVSSLPQDGETPDESAFVFSLSPRISMQEIMRKNPRATPDEIKKIVKSLNEKFGTYFRPGREGAVDQWEQLDHTFVSRHMLTYVVPGSWTVVKEKPFVDDSGLPARSPIDDIASDHLPTRFQARYGADDAELGAHLARALTSDDVMALFDACVEIGLSASSASKESEAFRDALKKTAEQKMRLSKMTADQRAKELGRLGYAEALEAFESGRMYSLTLVMGDRLLLNGSSHTAVLKRNGSQIEIPLDLASLI